MKTKDNIWKCAEHIYERIENAQTRIHRHTHGKAEHIQFGGCRVHPVSYPLSAELDIGRDPELDMAIQTNWISSLKKKDIGLVV